MDISPIKTRIIQPPQDDVLEAIKDSSFRPQEKDVVVVSSKVVAIHEGRCVKKDEVEKEELVKQEADVYIKKADSRWRICLKHDTFLLGSGIDESNAGEYYILLPKDPHQSARNIYDFIQETYSLSNFGVIIADSHSMPLRYGTVGVALGWHGFEPVSYFTGESDLFGRPAELTRINTVDSLATAGVFVMGELSEQTPLCVIQDAPHLSFTERNTSSELAIPPREDIYWPLLKGLYQKE